MKSRNEVLNYLEANLGTYISGEQIAKTLGLSRSAVWKIIRTLKDEGYPIDSKTNKGYRLDPQSSLLSEAALVPLLEKHVSPDRIHVYDSLTSTNSLAKEMAYKGAPQGTVIIAKEQTGGRGRMGRTFFSPKNTGLYISIILRPQMKINQSLFITAAAGALITQSIKNITGLDVQIKWVNDLYYQNKKVCGILTEASSDFESGSIDHLILGIGINMFTPESQFPDDLKDNAGALFSNQSNTERTGIRLAADLINTFTRPDVFDHRDDLMDLYKRHSLVLGKEVMLTGAHTAMTGTVIDFTPEGYLILKTDDDSKKIISSGEITLRMR